MGLKLPFGEGIYSTMSDLISEDEAALAAHRIVLAHFVSEAERRLGDDASDFLGHIRRAAIASVENAGSTSDAFDLRATKLRLARAIDAIFR